MKYLSVGHASIDRAVLPNGECLGVNLGGPGVFGYTGLKLFDDSSRMVLNIAEDFYENYGSWVEKNNVDTKGLYLCYDKTHTWDLVYEENGSYALKVYSEKELYEKKKEYGYTNVRPEQIKEQVSADTKGLYIFVEPLYMQFWKQLKAIKDEYGFEVMHEIYLSEFDEKEFSETMEALGILKPEMASLNYNECCLFFKTEDIDEIISRIIDLDIPMFFLRAGTKGSYVIFDKKAYFTPIIDLFGNEGVDATGCGNSSTAAAMYAWINTRNPVMTGILANAAAGLNASYKGVIKDLGIEQRKNILELAEKKYDEYVNNHEEYVLLGYPKTGKEVLSALE